MASERIGRGPTAPQGPVEGGSPGAIRCWRVGPDRVELTGGPAGWSARVVRSDWAGAALDLDGHFADQAEALAWCERMARVLGRDREEEARP